MNMVTVAVPLQSLPEKHLNTADFSKDNSTNSYVHLKSTLPLHPLIQ